MVIKIALKGDLSDVFNNDKDIINGSIKNKCFSSDRSFAKGRAYFVPLGGN